MKLAPKFLSSVLARQESRREALNSWAIKQRWRFALLLALTQNLRTVDAKLMYFCRIYKPTTLCWLHSASNEYYYYPRAT